jgi:hypothetical protein
MRPLVLGPTCLLGRAAERASLAGVL